MMADTNGRNMLQKINECVAFVLIIETDDKSKSVMAFKMSYKLGFVFKYY
jgi:hypothetical protein